MKLPEYAKRIGVTRFTAHKWFHEGKIPGAYQLPSGLIYVPDSIFGTEKPKPKGLTVVYARVSSSEQRKTNLETQAERLTQFAIANGWVVDKVIKEVGSGLNDDRKKLTDLLRSDVKIDRIIVEHKDRLTRFGFNYLQILADKLGFEIIVVNPTMTDNEDLMQDFASIITSFCARLYSRRRAKRQTEKIIQSLNQEESHAVDRTSSHQTES
jgi:resolvase domain protein